MYGCFRGKGFEVIGRFFFRDNEGRGWFFLGFWFLTNYDSNIDVINYSLVFFRF